MFQGNWERDDSFILFMILPKYEPWKSPVFSRFMKKKTLNDPNVMLLNVKQTLDMCRIIPNILSLRVRDQAGNKVSLPFLTISHLTSHHITSTRDEIFRQKLMSPKIDSSQQSEFLAIILISIFSR